MGIHRGRGIRPIFIDTQLFKRFFKGLREGFFEFFLPGVRGEQALGLEHAVDAGGGEAEDTEDVGGVVEVAAGGVMLDEAAGEEAEEGDLVFEAFYRGRLEVGELALVEAAGVEAVLEGIGVAGLGAGEGGGFGGAAGFGGGGMGGHGGIIAQMF